MLSHSPGLWKVSPRDGPVRALDGLSTRAFSTLPPYIYEISISVHSLMVHEMGDFTKMSTTYIIIIKLLSFSIY